MFNKQYISQTIRIGGMSCEHCKNRVEKSLMQLKEVKSVEVSLEDKKAIVILKKPLDIEVLKETVENLGFSFEGAEK